MSLIDFDGFGYITSGRITNDMIDMGWESNNFSGPGNEGTGPYAKGRYIAATSIGNLAIHTLGGNLATAAVGFHVFVAGLPTSLANGVCFQFYDSASVQCGVGIDTTGRLFFFRGTSATILATGAATLLANTYYHIEVKVTFGNTGAFEVRLNGVVEISGSGVDTTNTANDYATKFGLRSVSASGSRVANATWATDFVGETVVENLLPTASGDSTGFTPSAGSNWQNVDEVNGSDDDTTYNSTTVTATVDLFNVADLSVTPTAIHAVKTWVKARKDDAGVRAIRSKLKSGATTVNEADLGLLSTYALQQGTVRLTDPNTAAAWTKAGIDALQVGYEDRS